mmetsp:Transcript_14653/g.10536  ORF Transcript_14653/g.10536 Transcript_14653/m.10536 type:complete len:84 (+) Transcript_14653:274-525(+)|eukprot:CAMPEP_0202957154 /NCGR_PEP_ID=MMETSP1396-20130829/1595_1 /ASSEMBLY_ACC=CAM_ASM_000872 /TAXON_ID= /ORGANISM="Pseudokeronopsis sp., Strain Brazil" /LENGTH=83 /DNA_ID=CAMNT_0049674503 /DNA_START=274 /DNA_END=525 /DNA_ORIENTATION=-
MQQAVKFNRLFLVFWDFDNRFYTYNAEYSADGVNWTRFATDAYGKNGEEIVFNSDVTAKYLRFDGVNNKNNYIHLLHVHLDYY